MTPAKLRAYAIMLPRLQAADRLARIADVAVATGSVEEASSARQQQRLQRQASAGQGRQARKPTAADLSAMGVKIVSADG